MQNDPEIRDQQFVCLSILNTSELFYKQLFKEAVKFMTSEYSEISLDHFEKLYYEYITKYTKNMLNLKRESQPSIKIRGAFESLTDASEFCEELRETMSKEPIDIYVVAVGKWVPFCSRSTTTNLKEVEQLMNYTVYSYGVHYDEERQEFESRLVNRTLKEKTKAPKTTLHKGDSTYSPDTDYLTEDIELLDQRFAVVSTNGDASKFCKTFTRAMVVSFVHSYIVDTDKTKTITKKDIENIFTEETAPTTEFQPCFKVRGCFITEEDSRKSAKNFQTTDQTIDTLVARVGFWLPIVVPADAVEQEYDNTELNTIRDVMKTGEEKVAAARSQMIAQGMSPEDHTKDPNNPKPDDSKLDITVEPTLTELLDESSTTEDARTCFNTEEEIKVVEL
jgi:hypothetical protein